MDTVVDVPLDSWTIQKILLSHCRKWLSIPRDTHVYSYDWWYICFWSMLRDSDGYSLYISEATPLDSFGYSKNRAMDVPVDS